LQRGLYQRKPRALREYKLFFGAQCAQNPNNPRHYKFFLGALFQKSSAPQCAQCAHYSNSSSDESLNLERFIAMKLFRSFLA